MAIDLTEAARQLEQAAHDARVAFDCIGLDELDRAHTHAITARAAADAAENVGSALDDLDKAAGRRLSAGSRDPAPPLRGGRSRA